MSQLLDGVGDLVIADTDQAEALHPFFASVLTSKVSWASVHSEGVQGGEELPAVDKNLLRDRL